MNSSLEQQLDAELESWLDATGAPDGAATHPDLHTLLALADDVRAVAEAVPPSSIRTELRRHVLTSIAEEPRGAATMARGRRRHRSLMLVFALLALAVPTVAVANSDTGVGQFIRSTAVKLGIHPGRDAPSDASEFEANVPAGGPRRAEAVDPFREQRARSLARAEQRARAERLTSIRRSRARATRLRRQAMTAPRESSERTEATGGVSEDRAETSGESAETSDDSEADRSEDFDDVGDDDPVVDAGSEVSAEPDDSEPLNDSGSDGDDSPVDDDVAED